MLPNYANTVLKLVRIYLSMMNTGIKWSHNDSLLISNHFKCELHINGKNSLFHYQING